VGIEGRRGIEEEGGSLVSEARKPTCRLGHGNTCVSMNEDDNRESVNAGQTGETTAEVTGSDGGGAGREVEAREVLTSSDVTRLLSGDLAKADGEAAGEEVQPAGEAGETLPGDGKGEVRSPKSEGEEAELTEGLRAELEAWEANGGGTLPAALQVLVDKRIGKLTGQREAAEKRVAELEHTAKRVAELEQELTTLRSDPTRTAPATRVASEKHLDGLEAKARQFVADVENYLDETADDAERDRVESHMKANGRDVKGLKRELREVAQYLATEMPKEREALRTFRKAEAESAPVAKKYFPWLDDKASAEYRTAQEVLGIVPDLDARTPGHRVALGIWVLGHQQFMKMLEADAKGNGGVKAAQVPIKTPTRGSAAPARRVNGHQAEEQAARERFNRAPTAASVTELLNIGLRS